MEELRRLLRRLERADLGAPDSSASETTANAKRSERLVSLAAQPLPLTPPPLPSLPPLPPRWPAEPVMSAAKPPGAASKGGAFRPGLVTVSAIGAVVLVGLILRIDLPRPAPPMPPSPAHADANTSKDAAPGSIATASVIQAAEKTPPAPEKPAYEERAAPSFAPPSVDAVSAGLPAPPPSTATSTGPTPAAVAVPVQAEQRVAVLEPAKSLPLPARSTSSAGTVLAIPPSFMIEAGVTSPFPLRLARDTAGVDGGYVIVSGLLRGSRFSSGTEIVFDTWQIPVGALGDLQLTIPGEGEAELAIELRSAQGETVARASAVLQGVNPASAPQHK